MTTWLLDGNILIASAIASHIHHERVRRWRYSTQTDFIASCSVTESTLLRLHMILATDRTSEAAWKALASLHAHPKHVFWTDDFSYLEVSHTRLSGHRQITDAWLAELARRKGAKFATLDEGLATLWPDVAVLVPV